MNLAPIAIFCYNRPFHFKKTIDALKNNPLASESILYFFSDGSKNNTDQTKVDMVRKIIHETTGFKEIFVREQTENSGLANSIIRGVSEVVNKHLKVIVIEDDLVVSTDFLDYMNRALSIYENDQRIFSISGYSATKGIHPNLKQEQLFLHNRINSWGWASWANRWKMVDWEVSDFDSFIRNKQARKQFNEGGVDLWSMLMKQQLGKTNSWAIRFNYTCFRLNKLNIYPVKSKVKNLGADGSGTNVEKTTRYASTLSDEKIVFPKVLSFKKEYALYYNQQVFKQSLFRKIINQSLRLLHFGV